MNDVERTADPMRCPECGGTCVKVAMISAQLVPESALSNPFNMKMSGIRAHTCASCGYTRLYAERPEKLA